MEQNLCTPESDEDQMGIEENGAVTVQQVCYSIGDYQLKLTIRNALRFGLVRVMKHEIILSSYHILSIFLLSDMHKL